MRPAQQVTTAVSLPHLSFAELSSLLKELTSDLRHNPCVDHAIRVHQSWFLNDYHQFFKLYRSSPNLSRSLIDMFVDRERKAALKSMAKAYVASSKWLGTLAVVW